MDCRKIEHWVLFEDGEKSVNESRQLREHLSTCVRCAARHQKALDWINQWSAPVGQLTAEAAAVNVLARLDERTRRDTRAPAMRHAWGGALGFWDVRRLFPSAAWMGLAVSVGALALVIGKGVSMRGTGGVSGSEFAPRSAELGAPASLRRQVGVSFRVVSDLRELAPESTLEIGDAIVGSYVNLGGAGPVYVLSFAVDALEEVHWLYPAYLDPSDDPEAVVLAETAGSERLMPEAVVVDAAPGALRIFTITSTQKLRVSQIEAMPAGSFTREGLSQAFVGVDVSELPVQVVRER